MNCIHVTESFWMWIHVDIFLGGNYKWQTNGFTYLAKEMPA